MGEITDRRLNRSTAARMPGFEVNGRRTPRPAAMAKSSPIRAVASADSGPVVPTAPGAVHRSVRQPTLSERRSAARNQPPVQVVVRHGERQFVGVCMELSDTGGMLACAEVLQSGERLALTVPLHEGDPPELCLVASVGDLPPDRTLGQMMYKIQWLSATSAAGPRVLLSYLRTRMAVVTDHAAVTSVGGFAVYRFTAGAELASAGYRRASDPAIALPVEDDSHRDEPTVPLQPQPQEATDRFKDWPDEVPKELASRYSHLRKLGSGGYGVVYEASDDLLDRRVALKFMQPSLDAEHFRRQFLREVRTTVGLAHPNVIRIYDAGTVGETLYFTMESIAGRTLAEHMRPGGTDLLFTARVIRQLAGALDYLHGRGILHCDVKPDNVLVERSGAVQLFDFGLARSKADKRGERSVILGTPQYMAPEQPHARELDGRIDQYSLAVVAYEMLTGRLPFAAGNMFLAHALVPMPDPRMFRAELPDAVVPVLRRGMAKEQAHRFETCLAFARSLALTLGIRKASN